MRSSLSHSLNVGSASAGYPPFPRISRLCTLVSGIGAACALLGLLVIIGWETHCVSLIQLRPTLAPMQFNCSLCLVLTGVALCLWRPGMFHRAVLILGAVVAAIGSLSLCEYLFHTNLGIDQLLCHYSVPSVASDGPNVGRMAPVSALCFALMGLALLSLGLPGDAHARWRPLASGSLASVVISVGLVILAGYAIGLPGTVGWGQLTRIAIHTAAGLSLAGSGLLLIAWTIALHPGERTPRWLPVPLALAFFTGSLVLYFALEGKQDQDIAQTVQAGAQGAKNQIAVRMEARFQGLARRAQDWEFSGTPTQAAWEASAASYIHDLPDVQALEWIDATRRVRWIVPFSAGRTSLDDLTLDDRHMAALEEAQRKHEPVVTRLVNLPEGGLGFVLYAPIVVNGRSDGFLATVFKAQTCIQRYLPMAIADGEAISLSEGGKTFYERDAAEPPTRKDWTVQEKIDLHGATWSLHVWPTPALAAALDSPLPAVVLWAGSLGALLLGAVSFFAQRSSREAAAIARANAALHAALNQVKTLEGLLPICCYCKRVRDDTGYWNQIDTYLRKHTKASLSHSYCPECAVKFYEECGCDVPDKVKAELAAGNFE